MVILLLSNLGMSIVEPHNSLSFRRQRVTASERVHRSLTTLAEASVIINQEHPDKDTFRCSGVLCVPPCVSPVTAGPIFSMVNNSRTEAETERGPLEKED